MNNPAYQIGASQATMVGLESLGLPLPKATPVRYSKLIDLGDGTVRGAGWLHAEWRFAYLNQAQLAALRTYCSGSSAVVYVRTLDEDGDYSAYSAVMVWPDVVKPRADLVLDFAIEFRKMTGL